MMRPALRKETTNPFWKIPGQDQLTGRAALALGRQTSQDKVGNSKSITITQGFSQSNPPSARAELSPTLQPQTRTEQRQSPCDCMMMAAQPMAVLIPAHPRRSR